MRTPSAATVIATLALFVALGGTGYAVTKLPSNSVGTAQLKKNAVTSAKVKDGSLKRADLAADARTVAAGDLAPDALGSSVTFTALEQCRVFDMDAASADSLIYVNSHGTYSTSGQMFCPLAGVPVGARVTSVDVGVITANTATDATIIAIDTTPAYGLESESIAGDNAGTDDGVTQTLVLTPPAGTPVVVGGRKVYMVAITTPDADSTVTRVTVHYQLPG